MTRLRVICDLSVGHSSTVCCLYVACCGFSLTYETLCVVHLQVSGEGCSSPSTFHVVHCWVMTMYAKATELVSVMFRCIWGVGAGGGGR
jgi:hypothetical protein